MARGAFFLLLTQPVTWSASLITTAFVPHLLGAQTYGQFAVVVALGTVANTIVTLGIPSLLIRKVATEAESFQATSVAALSICVSSAVVASLVLFFALPPLGLPAPRGLLAAALVALVIAAANSVVMAILNGQERHQIFALTSAIAGSAPLVGVPILAVTHNIVAFVATNAAVMAMVTVWGWSKAGVVFQRRAYNLDRWYRLGFAGLPFLAAALTVGIYGSIDNILLGFFARAEVVGWYAAAYRIIAIPVFIPTLLVTPLFPALSRQVADWLGFRQSVTHTLIAVLYTNLPLCALVIALAPAVPTTLHWAPSFGRSVPLMQILALHEPLVGIDMVLVTAVQALRMERRWLWVSAFLAFVNPASNLLLIPLTEAHFHNGAIGAAIATVGTEVLAFFGAWLLLPRGTLDRHILSVGARASAAAICLGITASALRSISLPLSVTVGLLCYAGVGAMLRLWTPADLRRQYDAARATLQKWLSEKRQSVLQP